MSKFTTAARYFCNGNEPFPPVIMSNQEHGLMEIDSQNATNDNSSKMTISINWVALQIDENRIFVQIETFALISAAFIIAFAKVMYPISSAFYSIILLLHSSRIAIHS